MQRTETSRVSRKTPFSALANKVRLDLIFSLMDGDKNVSELVEELGLGQALVSNGLKKLMEVGFVSTRPSGKFRYYSLNKEFATPFLAAIDRDGRQGKGNTGMLLRVILQQAPISIAVTDKRGVFTFIGGDMVRKFGITDETFIGKTIYDLFYDDRKNIVVNISGALRGETVNWSTTHCGASFDVVSVPYKTASGEVAGALNVAYEVSPRQDAQRKLAEEGAWKTLAQGTSYTLAQLDLDGNIIAMNRGSERYPGRDFTGKNVWDLMRKEFQPAAKKAIAAAIKTSDITTYWTAAIDEGRPNAYFECRVSPFQVGGKIVGVTVASHEVERAAVPIDAFRGVPI
ncbi:MAG TPA: metalloregulator ArsR/SmtB family transcription factor [Candidatus Eisenbacteria bacterium]|jgi:PAS domain S-box-containing protein|nr:metalloregulator ArsR/SmtB family transcription factor [Candidatus Eisenbacteria bacterium]